MANILGNSNINATAINNNCNSNIVLIPVGIPANTVVQSNMSDICSYLQPAPTVQGHGDCPYDHIIEMMRGLDLQDDGIVMNHKIKSIEVDFCNIVRNEEMLTDCMEYINNIALTDGDTSLKFALLFSSRNFDALAMNETKVRCAMLKILETNFLNAELYRIENKNVLYNSITMLGEYYHRVRLADNSPITILGESLLNLLLHEVNGPDCVINVKLAKLILSQITLNGDIMRVKHKAELTRLLFHIRRNLIEQHMLKPIIKALLLMTLDLYYSNFANLGPDLEEMYTKYLILPEEEDEEGREEESNNNLLQEPTMNPQQYQLENYQNELPQPVNQSIQIVDPHDTQFQAMVNPLPEEGLHNTSESINNGNCVEEPYHISPMTKKWSEQVSEESFYENEYSNSQLNGETELNLSSEGSGRTQTHNFGDNRDERTRNEYESSSSNSRRSYKQCNSPRPLKQNCNVNNKNFGNFQQSASEERDQSKPLPRWRATRFNRDTTEQQQNNRQRQRRYSASFDDDRHSVRSDSGSGGGIRLYSINDRLKHSQEKIDRNNSNAFNSIANSNWDRQSQRDDRSERSYASNYERGNQRRGNRQYNNRQMYDKPPRFQKNQHQQNKDGSGSGNIKSETWRRSATSYHDENSSYTSNGPDSNSRSSSRARTLPRPAKSRFETTNTSNSSASSYYRRPSQSPSTHFRDGQYNNRNGGNNRGRHTRCSSQGSLNKESSSKLMDCRQNNRNNRNFDRLSKQPPPPQSTHQQEGEDSGDIKNSRQTEEEKTWDSKDNNTELVRNARNTTNYMNYLSSKK